MFGEYLGGVVAAGQVARVWLSQAAEVDQAPDALARGRGRERFGAGVLAGREIAACSSAHGVDEVVGDVDVAADALEGLGAEDVGLVEFEAGALLEVACARSVAHRAADGPAVVGECGREQPADEAGRASQARAAWGWTPVSQSWAPVRR